MLSDNIGDVSQIRLPQQNDMLPSSPPSGGFRESVKRRTHRLKNLFRLEAQAPAPRTPSPRTPSPQSQPQSREPPGVPLPQLTHEPQQLGQSQQSLSLPHPKQNVTVPTSGNTLVAANSAQSVNVELTPTQVAKKVGAGAWIGLKATLKLLERSSDAFPPLKSAVAGFLGVVDVFEASDTAAQNKTDYAELASNLEHIIDEFNQHPGEHTSSKMSDALKAMKGDLEKELEHALGQPQHSGFRRHYEAGQDAIDVQECRRRVDTLCRELQNKVLAEVWRNQKEQQADARLDKLNAALKAMYNSSLSDVVGRRRCTPGTREAILAEMRGWVNNPDGPNVYWLNGMAGTGKTTLAYSFCAEMQLAGRLGASFFCSRADAESRDVSRIVPTIAHQLAGLLPSYRDALIRQMSEDKEIGARRIEAQFEMLVRNPLRQIQASVPTGILVMIDALDECEGRDGAQDILNALLLYARDLPIKFFVTCRPEPGLFDMLQSQGEHHRAALSLHDIEASFVKADIKTYLEDELGTLSLSQEKLGQLAEQAGTLFIYAATVARYVHPKSRRVNVHQRLDDLLSATSETGPEKHKGIDKLYTAVLAAPFADEDLTVREKKNVRLALDTALCVSEPVSITTMAKLMDLEEEDVACALQHLRSVLHISQGTELISTLHASFSDFMLDPERSKDLGCNLATHHQHILIRCFSTMQRLLRFNICELGSSFDLDENVPGLAKKIEAAIPPELFYACRYWADHLVFAESVDDVCSALEGFLSKRLLFWMEVLNLARRIHMGVGGLYRVQAWTQRTSCPVDIQQLARDAAGFVTVFSSNAVSRSTPHIYISALPFWPEQRPISKHYSQKMKGLPKAGGTGMRIREAAPLAICVTPSRVLSLAYSSNGARIVSGSEDHMIRIWDAHTGKMIGKPLKGHTGGVNSVAYSPDDTRIVSGSDDNTIRIWDAHIGKMIGEPLEGHTEVVWSVAYSSDNTHVVSGSEDHMIRIWDAHTGKMIGEPFEGHTKAVVSVAYSSDNARIVSGSDDKTIRIWDVRTGKMIGEPLEGHTRRVTSVAYSSDNARIVSGSSDETIRIWDAHTGKMTGELLQGHTNAVWSVAYSSDNTRVVSGSRDKTIRIWDAHTGKMIGEPFEGHTKAVVSVAYSSDNACIVSGSYDNTIRIWDAHTGKTIGEPLEGHTGLVWSVAYSSDDARIVSGSDDNTIRIWDAHTGKMIGEPLEGHTGAVMSVAYSSDNTHIVSGSDDNTIRIWDAHSGKTIGELLKGHTGAVMSVAYSSDNARIVSGSEDNTIRIWKAHTGKVIGEPLEGHTGAVVSVAYSSDDARIVSGSDDNTIRIWDAHTGRMIGEPLEGHTGVVMSVAYSSDDARIVSGSHDNNIRIWDVRTGEMVGEPPEGYNIIAQSVAHSFDGTCSVSGSSNSVICTTNLGHASGDPYDTRVVNEDGYILADGSKLVMWVPSDVRDILLRPQNTALISTLGSVKVDFTNAHIGDSWARCYQSA